MYAPGVTSPLSLGGLTSEEVVSVALESGKLGDRLKMVDVSEYNPMSEDYRTGKLATTILYYTLLGLKQSEK